MTSVWLAIACRRVLCVGGSAPLFLRGGYGVAINELFGVG
jgi:hypothetical protein